MTGPRDRDPQENLEQIQALARGPRGEAGAAGETGPRGLGLLQARAVAFLFVLSVVLAGAAYILSVRQSTANEHKWCATIVLLDQASRAGPPPTTPYGLKLRADFHQLRGELGCG